MVIYYAFLNQYTCKNQELAWKTRPVVLNVKPQDQQDSAGKMRKTATVPEVQF